MPIYDSNLSYDVESAKKKLDHFIEKGKTFELKEVKKKRSISQNSLYWLYVNYIANDTGNDREAIHDELRRMFLPVNSGLLGNKEIYSLTSTTSLDTLQFTQFIDKIVVWASSELGIILPNPEDKIFEEFKEKYKNII